MPSLNHIHSATENRLLAILPDKEYEQLLPDLKLVFMRVGETLYEFGQPLRYVYFPNNNAVISLLTTMEDGTGVEVGVVGREGVAGVGSFMGIGTASTLALVQIGGSAMRIEANKLRAEFRRCGELQDLLLRYMYALFIQVSKTAACNRLHTVEARLSRWLLLIQDRAQSNTLPLTQTLIAQMLGTRRQGVTEAAGKLQHAGLIHMTRGKIIIVDRKGLEAKSCECYATVKAEFARALKG